RREVSAAPENQKQPSSAYSASQREPPPPRSLAAPPRSPRTPRETKAVLRELSTLLAAPACQAIACPMDWAAWRAEFPILARKTYLNSCSLGALSLRAEAKLRTFLDEWHDRGAADWYDTWLGRLDEVRGRVARLIGAEPHEVALAASVSAALAAVASAIDYTRRPRVVSDLDFPTLAYQWMARPDVEVVHVRSEGGATIEPERFAEVIDDRTAVLAASHVYFATGAIQDLRALAD